MTDPLRWIYHGVRGALGLPLLAVYYSLGADDRELVRGDMQRWSEIKCDTLGFRHRPRERWQMELTSLLMRWPEFRTVYYVRAHGSAAAAALSVALRVVYRPLPNLVTSAKSIGPGLYVEHGFGAIVVADTLGRNLWLNQGATIGLRGKTHAAPRIGDDVFVRAGAKVLGDVTIGDRVDVGANAVVVKDVPSDCTVVGVPARIARRNGVRVDETL